MSKIVTRPSYTYKCDWCSTAVTYDSDHGERPQGWALLSFESAAQDYQGCEVGPDQFKQLVCHKCKERARRALSPEDQSDAG